MNGVELIAAERERQKTVEGWRDAHDADYKNEELLKAAMCYLSPVNERDADRHPSDWPWHKSWWKPTPNDRVRELVKAGALIAAEIDRLQRITYPVRALTFDRKGNINGVVSHDSKATVTLKPNGKTVISDENGNVIGERG